MSKDINRRKRRHAAIWLFTTVWALMMQRRWYKAAVLAWEGTKFLIRGEVRSYE